MDSESKIIVRRASERGATTLDWLDSRHSFSFGQYHDPRFMGYRSLRVINDDIIAPGKGFGMHGHRDMEIISVVVSGALEHRDSLGNGEVLRPGEVQAMSAGTGIRHSEFNPSSSEPVRLLQIWIEPQQAGVQSRYAQRSFIDALASGSLCRVAGPTAQDDQALVINQDVHVYLCRFATGTSCVFKPQPRRGAWIQVIDGELSVCDRQLKSGDGCAIEGQAFLSITGLQPGQFILFDLA